MLIVCSTYCRKVMRMKVITRPMYLKKMIDVLETPDIKVITGIRRSGKSQLLLSLIDYIREHKKNVNIININLQEIEFEELLEYHTLHQYCLDHYQKDMDNYLFIDEIQMCKGFEKAINSLHTKGIYHIYLTGSNAFLLSSDLSTSFTGRTFTIEVYPFSFMEFMMYFDLDDLESI